MKITEDYDQVISLGATYSGTRRVPRAGRRRVDPPGWIREPDGREEELRVTLTLGHRRGDRPATATRDRQRRGHDR